MGAGSVSCRRMFRRVMAPELLKPRITVTSLMICRYAVVQARLRDAIFTARALEGGRDRPPIREPGSASSPMYRVSSAPNAVDVRERAVELEGHRRARGQR